MGGEKGKARAPVGPYLPVGDIDGQVYVPEGARTNLPHQLVFVPDNELGLGAAAARHGDGGDGGRGLFPTPTAREFFCRELLLDHG